MEFTELGPKFFRAIRVASGRSQAQVADEAKCSRSQINQLEHAGRNMNLNTFVRLMESLGIVLEVKLTSDYIPSEKPDGIVSASTVTKETYLGRMSEDARLRGRPLPAYRVQQILKEHKQLCALAIIFGEPIADENRREYDI